ncbi:MAG: acyl-CoA dehydrogenase family protein [Alphaproteobacteria bacterium]
MVVDMFTDMTKRQRDFVYGIRELGQKNFRARAAKNDAEPSFPFENYEDMRKAGYFGLNIPESYGGMGATFFEYALFAAELGRWDAATALTFNMHTCTMMWSDRMVDDLPLSADERKAHDRRRAIIYEKVLKEGAIFAQPFSEPNSGAAAGKAPFGTAAKRVDGGWVVNGTKHFASLSGAAHFYGVVCTEEKPGQEHNVKDTMLLAVPAKANGVSIFGGWDVLGMRPTDSRSLKFEDVFVPEDYQVMPRGAYYQAALNWPHMFTTLSPTYLGIAQAAFEFTVGYLRGEVEGAPPPMAKHSPAKQMAVAEMRIKLEQAKALLWRTMSEARINPSKDDRLRAYANQYTIMEFANDICRLGLRACGGRAIFKNFMIERLYRDSRCGSLMLPWTAEICLERLGRESLFEPGEK